MSAAFAGLWIASASLVGHVTVAPDATDRSGQTGPLEDGTPKDRWGGFGSGMAWDQATERLWFLSDRGPGDGVTSYHTRLHRTNLTSGRQGRLDLTIEHSVLMYTEDETPLTGLANAVPGTDGMLRFDPEGLAIAPDGKIYVSDEYEPKLVEIDRAGRVVREFPMPAKVLVDHPSGDPNEELEDNAAGRVPNRGLEGLTVTPDGRTLVAIFQGALIQDGEVSIAQQVHADKPEGINVRILTFDALSGRHLAEYVYRLEDKKLGVSEILALTNDRFLVLERDGKKGNAARMKQIFEIDLRGATNVMNRQSLPPDDLPRGVTPVSKRLYLDLLDPEYGIKGAACPEKIESLAWLPGGRLAVASDNDFKDDQPSHLWVFAIP